MAGSFYSNTVSLRFLETDCAMKQQQKRIIHQLINLLSFSFHNTSKCLGCGAIVLQRIKNGRNGVLLLGTRWKSPRDRISNLSRESIVVNFRTVMMRDNAMIIYRAAQTEISPHFSALPELRGTVRKQNGRCQELETCSLPLFSGVSHGTFLVDFTTRKHICRMTNPPEAGSTLHRSYYLSV